MQLLKVGHRRHNKPFTTVGAILFTAIACTYLLRLLMGWEVTVNGMVVPK
jgi:hypothetical protein